MNRVFAAAWEIHQFCERRSWPFCFIGGMAVQRWGEQRATDDVDLTLATGWGAEERFADELLPSFPIRPGFTRERLLTQRVLFVTASNGIGIDVALGAIPFELRTVERSSLWEINSEQRLRTCSAEDLLVHKCFANRDRDWIDAEGVLIRQWRTIDLKQVHVELQPLADLKESPEILIRLNDLVKKLSQSPVLSELRRQ